MRALTCVFICMFLTPSESAYDEGNVVQILPSHVTSTGYAGAGLAWETPVLRVREGEGEEGERRRGR